MNLLVDFYFGGFVISKTKQKNTYTIINIFFPFLFTDAMSTVVS